MRTTTVLILVLASVGLVACDEERSVAPATEPVTNEALGVRFSDLPRACEVTENEGDELELGCDLTDRQTTGTLHVELGEIERSVNLKALATAQKEDFESLPGGEFKGNSELVTPGGPAYTARGRYDEDGEDVEEMRVFTLHPRQNRPLILRFVYPEGDSTKARIDQLFAVLGELEGVGTRTPAPTAPDQGVGSTAASTEADGAPSSD